MVNVDLVMQRVTEINVKIDFNPEDEKTIEIGFNSPFRIQYADDNKHCTAILEQKAVSQKNPDQFSIYIKLEGFFDCDEITDSEKKKEIHVQCYYRLFPYAQSLIAQICVTAGLPPLMIRSQSMSINDVVLPEDKTN